MLKFLKMRWLFNRRVGWTALWVVGLLAVAALVNLVGVRLAGDVEGWMQWLKAHSLVFLAWRLALYLAVACGWWWMRQRVIARETDIEARKQARLRFIRIETAAICTLLVLEISNGFA